MARIVLSTFGSLGDLHPYLALGCALRSRGHEVTLASHGTYRARVEASGLAFAPVRPDLEAFGDLDTAMRAAMHPTRGSVVVLRDLVLPHLRDSAADLWAATEGADLLVDHALAFASPLVAERRGIPRVSTVLQPLTTFPTHTGAVFPGFPSALLQWLGPWAWRAFWATGRAVMHPWFTELRALRHEWGLATAQGHPLIDQASHDLHLVLFSRVLMPPQPDWSSVTVQTGFPWYDRGEAGEGMPQALTHWLDAGEPPIVFTLGSSAVFTADRFYDHAAAAARTLGRRAVLLTGIEDRNPVAGVPDLAVATTSDAIVRVSYAPHSEVMPRACAVVHQGGIGTTAQALRAGRPTLVVPFSHDQPDNAMRVTRLGVGRTLARPRVSTAAFVRELGALLADPAVAARAREVADVVRHESGADGAADAIERLLAARRAR